MTTFNKEYKNLTGKDLVKLLTKNDHNNITDLCLSVEKELYKRYTQWYIENLYEKHTK